MSGPSLEERLKPFPSKLIHDNPSGYGTYVAHGCVKERLLDLYGSYSFELVQILRGAAGKCEGDVIVGVVFRMTVQNEDGPQVIEDVGDCEIPSNWPHDGARLKDAISDALKRCAAHTGIGLHLWVGEDAYLYEKLKKGTS